MIIVKLSGGLGNQMFQYAAGVKAASDYNTILKLDVSALQKKNWANRIYSLGNFNLEENFASPKEIKKLKPSRLLFIGKLSPALFNLANIDKHRTYLKEDLYSNRINTFHDNLYLEGQWQSEKYFLSIRKTILKEFSLKKPLSKFALSFKKIIKTSNSVSIHLRRKDYLTQKMAKIYPVCSLSYYQRAALKMTQRIDKPHFFIFTDDVAWTKENLTFLKYFTIVSGSGTKDFEEIFLMSQCQHNVIANSSFSWWGAWLNINPKKITIAPRRWFTNNSFNSDNIIPNSWIKI